MSMGTGMKIGIGVVVMVLLFGGCGACSVVSGMNTMQKHENGIEAQYDRDQNSLSTHVNRVMEMVQVPKMAKNQIKDVVKANMEGRYGDNGSKAVFQAIAEQNATMPKELYINLQHAMDAGRTDFQADQNMRIDKCNAYRDFYTVLPWSLLANFTGRPHIDMKKMCTPVIAEAAAESFRTGRTEALDILGDD